MKKNKVIETKVSTNYQTYVPAEVQKKLNLKKGEKLEWVVNDKGDIKVEKAKSQLEKVQALYGIAEGIYDDVGGAVKWIRKERESWDE